MPTWDSSEFPSLPFYRVLTINLFAGLLKSTPGMHKGLGPAFPEGSTFWRVARNCRWALRHYDDHMPGFNIGASIVTDTPKPYSNYYGSWLAAGLRTCPIAPLQCAVASLDQEPQTAVPKPLTPKRRRPTQKSEAPLLVQALEHLTFCFVAGLTDYGSRHFTIIKKPYYLL